MKRRIAVILVFTLLFSMSFASYGMANLNNELKSTHETLEEKLEVKGLSAEGSENGLKDTDKVRIIVELETEPVIKKATQDGVRLNEVKDSTYSSLEATIVDEQKVLESELDSIGIEYDLHNSFVNIFNGMAMTTTYGEAKEIEKIASVKSVSQVHEFARPEMDSSFNYTDHREVWNDLGYKGQGMVVSIIDTGIDPTHKDFNVTTPASISITETDIDNTIGELEGKGKYFTEKVPYGYNYMDNNQEILDLGPEASMHGMHVAGTVAANGDEANGGLIGMAPEAQVLAMKVFGNDPAYPSTYGDVIIAAIDDSIKLGADVMNLSLGATAGTVDRDDPEQVAVTNAVENGILMAISAGNSRVMGYGSGLNPLAKNPDYGVLGSPSLTSESLSVASMNNQSSLVTTSFSAISVTDETLNFTGYGKDNWNDLLNIDSDESIVLTKIGGENLGGQQSDYDNVDVEGKVVLVYRGGYSFRDKTKIAAENGAKGIIVYDHGQPAFHKDQGGWEIPFAMIEKAPGLSLQEMLENGDIELTANSENYINPVSGKMSDFSSWGPLTNLDFKPDITAPGGYIKSTVNDDDYVYMSGTSMAAPHVAGGSALILEAMADQYDWNLTGKEKIERAKNILMNTAVPVEEDSDANAYASPRRQGAGAMNIANAVNAKVVVTDKGTGLAKTNLREISGDSVTITLEIMNFGDEALKYDLSANAQTDAMFEDDDKRSALESQEIQGVDIEEKTVTISPNTTEDVSLTISGLDTAEDASGYLLKEIFTNGFFVEGFVTLENQSSDSKEKLTVPYMGFKGDWDAVPIFDNSLYEEDGSSYYGLTGILDPMTYAFLGGSSKENIAISPNNDGVQDAALPIFSLMRNAKDIQMGIYKNDKKIRTIEILEDLRKCYYYHDQAPMYYLDNDYLWDATVNNEVVADGEYEYRITADLADDDDVKNPQTLTFPITVDTVVPSIESVVYENGGNEMTITGADTGSGIEKYQVINPETGELVIETSAVNNSIDLTDVPSQPVVVRAVDYAGNASFYMENGGMAVILINNGQAPVVDMTPASHGFVTNKEVTFEGTVTDTEGLALLTIAGETVETEMIDAGTYAFSYVHSFANDGKKSVDVYLEDHAGNSLEFERKFFLDSEKATLSELSINDEPLTEDALETGIVFEESQEELTLKGLAEDNYPEIEVVINGNEIVNIEKDYYSYDDNLTSVSEAFSEIVALTADEKNEIVIELTDAAGQKTLQTIEVYNGIDKPEPAPTAFTLNALELSNNTNVSFDRPLAFTISADKAVDWTVEIYDAYENLVDELTYENAETISDTWAPAEEKKINGDYTVKVIATNNNGEEETTHETSEKFDVYNFPMVINSISSFERAGQMNIKAVVENLNSFALENNPILVVKVSNDFGRVINLSTVETKVNGNDTLELTSGFLKPQTGEYSVEVFVWNEWEFPSGLALPKAMELIVD